MASQHAVARAEREPSREDMVALQIENARMKVCTPDECAPDDGRGNLDRDQDSFPETRFGRARIRGSGVLTRGANCPTTAPSHEQNPPVATHKRRGQRGLFALTTVNRAPYHLRAWRDYRVDIIELFAGPWLARACCARGSRRVRPLRPVRTAAERGPSNRWLRASSE